MTHLISAVERCSVVIPRLGAVGRIRISVILKVLIHLTKVSNEVVTIVFPILCHNFYELS